MSKAPKHAIAVNIALRWSDQDQLGHVNNAKIMTLVEEARIRALGRLQRQRRREEGSYDMVVRTATIDFLRPIVYRDAVQVNIWISRIGNSSFVMQHEVLQDDQICATLEAVMVMFDSQLQQPKTIPEAIREVFESLAA